MASTINADTSNGVIITPDTSGEIELQANGVTKAKVTANGLQDANGNSLRGGMYRNLIINGDMQIAQRGTSATGLTIGGYRTADRFLFGLGTAGTWTMSQDTDVPTGQGFANSAKMSCTTANASLSAGSFITFQQRFEGQNVQYLKKGTANAESVTLSFWVKSNKTGTCIAELSDRDNTRQISKSFTINSADTWEKKTITYEGDTTGTLNNDNDGSLWLLLWFSAGTNYTSGTLNTSWATDITANRVVGANINFADSTSNYINITGVQLEVGEGASDFEFLPYDVQLHRCQRYYWRIAGLDYPAIGSGVCTSTVNARIYVKYPVAMRTYPTISYSGTIYVQDAGNHTLTAILSAYEGLYTTMIDLTTSGLTVGRGCVVYPLNASTNYFQADAEL